MSDRSDSCDCGYVDMQNFTDRARKVMALAAQEARQFSHTRVGTGHILLGLVKVDSGVAANVFRLLDVDPRKIRLEIEKRIHVASQTANVGVIPVSLKVKLVLEYAREEKRKLGHNYVGTEHILLGLLHDSGGVAVQVLRDLGLTLEAVRQETLRLLGHDSEEPRIGPTAEGATELDLGLDGSFCVRLHTVRGLVDLTFPNADRFLTFVAGKHLDAAKALLRDLAIENTERERDEARETAKWLVQLVDEGNREQAVERYPWLLGEQLSDECV